MVQYETAIQDPVIIRNILSSNNNWELRVDIHVLPPTSLHKSFVEELSLADYDVNM